MESDKDYLMLNGGIDYALPQDAKLPDPAKPVKVRSDVVLYQEDEDQIHHIVMTGYVETITVSDPTVEERHAIDGLSVANLFKERGWDVHDFKEIVYWALDGLLHDFTNFTEDELAHNKEKMADLSSLYTELGGFE